VDTKTGKTWLVVQGGFPFVFSPDSRSISCVGDGVRIIPLDPVAEARRNPPRELTAAERRLYHIPAEEEDETDE
jgi:hypothetical protein